MVYVKNYTPWFGEHKGDTLEQIAFTDFSYLTWLQRDCNILKEPKNVNGLDSIKYIKQALTNFIPVKRDYNTTPSGIFVPAHCIEQTCSNTPENFSLRGDSSGFSAGYLHCKAHIRTACHDQKCRPIEISYDRAFASISSTYGKGKVADETRMQLFMNLIAGVRYEDFIKGKGKKNMNLGEILREKSAASIIKKISKDEAYKTLQEIIERKKQYSTPVPIAVPLFEL
jgi:hypothetical protein